MASRKYIPQNYWRTKQTNSRASHYPEMSFSDPLNVFSSDEESFDDKDMYGSDHGIDTICDSSDDGNEAPISQSPDGTKVSQ